MTGNEESYGDACRRLFEESLIASCGWMGKPLIRRLRAIGLTADCFGNGLMRGVYDIFLEMEQSKKVHDDPDIWMDFVELAGAMQHASSDSSILECLGGPSGVNDRFLRIERDAAWCIRMARTLIEESRQERLTRAMENAQRDLAMPGANVSEIMAAIGQASKELMASDGAPKSMTTTAAELLSAGSAAMSSWSGSWLVPSLDEAMPLCAPMCNVLAGKPGSGKTSLAMQACIASSKQGLKVCFVSLEMDAKSLAARQIANHTGVRIMDVLRGEVPSIKRAQALKAMALYQVDVIHRAGPLYRAFLAEITGLAKDGYNLIVIDYLQRVTGYAKQSQWEYIGQTATGLADIAREHQCTIMVLSQLTREGASDERKGGRITAAKELQATDLAGSGDIERAADAILMLGRADPADESMEIEIIGRGVKGRFTGETQHRMLFNKPRGQFSAWREDGPGDVIKRIRRDAPDDDGEEEDLFA